VNASVTPVAAGFNLGVGVINMKAAKPKALGNPPMYSYVHVQNHTLRS